MDATEDQRFDWHPEYRGRAVGEVETELAQTLRSDQRAYALMMEGAEQHESAVLASVLPMERRWGAFDLDWAEADPAVLAGRVVAFERERDRRRSMLSYAEFRAVAAPSPSTGAEERPWWAFWRR